MNDTPFDPTRAEELAKQLAAMGQVPSLRAMSPLFNEAAAQLRAAGREVEFYKRMWLQVSKDLEGYEYGGHRA